MATIIILEIEKDLIIPSNTVNIKSISKFYEEFSDNILAILFEKNLSNLELYNIIGHDNIVIEYQPLNMIARNRMINNFEATRPELTLTLMGASNESKLIKIWKKYVKR